MAVSAHMTGLIPPGSMFCIIFKSQYVVATARNTQATADPGLNITSTTPWTNHKDGQNPFPNPIS